MINLSMNISPEIEKYFKDFSKAIPILKNIFSTIENHCAAIYLGGSRVDPVIDNAHDYDCICFAKPSHYHDLAVSLKKVGFKPEIAGEEKSQSTLKQAYQRNNIDLNLDLLDISQMRSYTFNIIDWFAYLDHYMIKFIGEDVCPKPDLLGADKAAYLKDLKLKAVELSSKDWSEHPSRNKRWYHILRGVYILLNNSYEVTEEQKREINILHDLAEGWEDIRDKTIKLLETLK